MNFDVTKFRGNGIQVTEENVIQDKLIVIGSN